MQKIVFELCAESLEACLAAAPGGADRIELCTALLVGGLTPSYGLIHEAVRRSGLPVHVLLRPRAGDFLYTEDEFSVMCADLQHIVESGAAGVVLGVLRADRTVDAERTSELVARAGSLEVTFHRAFDETVSQSVALEDVIATGCRRVLTSGGADTVVLGATALRRLVEQAAGRIDIAVGGGLRLENAASVARTTGATHFHGSMQSDRKDGSNPSFGAQAVVRAEDIRAVIASLQRA